MQPMWCYAGNPVDLDDTNWRITPVDTNAKDSLNPEALQLSLPACITNMPVWWRCFVNLIEERLCYGLLL